MHKITSKKFELDDFSHEHLVWEGLSALIDLIVELNKWRNIYIYGGATMSDEYGINTDIFTPKDKQAWWQIIQLLPSSYNQRRTITMNYENVVSIIKQREFHKLDEWVVFVEELKQLPYIKKICGFSENSGEH